MRAAARVFVPIALLVACSEDYGSESVPASGDAAAADASSSDGSTSDAGAPTNDAGGASNLLSNSDFALGCAAWEAVNGAEGLEDSTGHVAGPSCRLCVGTGKTEGDIFQRKKPVAGGEEYSGAVWLRAAAGSSTTTKASVGLEVYGAGAAYLGGSAFNTITLDDTWKRATFLMTLPAGAQSINVNIHIDGASNCMLIDDAELTRR